MEILFIATLMEIAFAALLLVIFLLVRYFGKANDLKVKTAGKIPGVVISKAIVLSVENTGAMVNDQAQLKMQLQVLPDKGRNFVIELKETVSPADSKDLRTGSTIRVKYNPANTKEISRVKVV